MIEIMNIFFVNITIFAVVVTILAIVYSHFKA